LEEPVAADAVDDEIDTATISVRDTDTGDWRQIGRHHDVPDAIDAVSDRAVLVRAADYDTKPDTTVRVAVPDDAGQVADFFTTPAQ
jgi:hypothetical protein